MNIFLSISQAVPVLIWIFSSAFLFASADLLFRYWYQISSSTAFIAGLIIASVGMFCLAMSFPHHNVAAAIIISILLNIMIYLIAAYLFFGDTISYKDGLGLIVAFGAIYILEGMK